MRYKYTKLINFRLIKYQTLHSQKKKKKKKRPKFNFYMH